MSQAASSSTSGQEFGGDTFGAPDTSFAGSASKWVQAVAVAALAAVVIVLAIKFAKGK